MKFFKAIAVVVFAALLLQIGFITGVADGAKAGQAAAGVLPGVSVQEQEPSADGQSLIQTIGGPSAGVKSLLGAGTWGLSGNTSFYGSTCLEEGAVLYLEGHTLTVYGDLTISGKLVIDGGKLILKRDPKDIKNLTGNLIIEKGLLVMAKTLDYVEVEKSLIANGGDETGSLTAGTVKVFRDFLQLKDYSTSSYNETGTHSTVLGGVNKLVQFLSPTGSGIRNPTFLPGTTFTTSDRDISVKWSYIDSFGNTMIQDHIYKSTGGTFLSLTKPLTANYSITVPNLYYMGSQGNWTLAVNGCLIVPAGVSQSFTGNVSAGRIYLVGTLNLNAGSIATKDFDAYGNCNLNGGALTVSGSYCRHANPEDQSLLASADTGSLLTVQKDDASGFKIAAPAVNLSGNLGGHIATVIGSLTVPSGKTLTMDKGTDHGRLNVSGDMAVKGLLDMHNSGDAVVVGGDFTAAGDDSWGHLTNGYLALKGSFIQKDDISPKSFNPDSLFCTMLTGDAAQSVSFENPVSFGSSTAGSWFSTLYILNPAVTFATEHYSISVVNSSTKLKDIAATAGGVSPVLYPNFNANTLSYEILVPQGADTIFIATIKEDTGQTIETKVDGIPLAGDDYDGNSSIPVDPGKATVVTLQVMSDAGEPCEGAGDPFYTIYTLTVRYAPLLSNINVYADGASAVLRPAFSSAVHEYTADVPVNCSAIAVTGVKVLPGCTGLTVGGQPDMYSTAIDPGNFEDVLLTASAGNADDQKATYTVRVRKPLMSGLKLSVGTLDSGFNPDPAATTAVTIPYTAASVTLSPIGNDNGTGDVKFAYTDDDKGGAALPNATIVLAQGQTRHISIKAIYSGIEKVYKIDVIRVKSDNANLIALGAGAGWLSPVFNPVVTSYTLILPETIPSVVIKPMVGDSKSRYRIDALAYNTARTVALSMNGTATLKIVVTALRGNTKTYTVAVRRVSIVSSFSTTPVYLGYPSLSPGGADRLTFSYKLAMPSTVKIEIKKGSKWYTILSKAEPAPCTGTLAWDGKVGGIYLGAGAYTIRITPYWAGRAGMQKTISIRILSKPRVYINTLSPSVFTANGTNKLKVEMKWTVLCNVKAEVINSAGSVVRTIYSAACQAPATRTIYWDGKNAAGTLVPAGAYRLKLTCGGAACVYKPFTLKR